MAKKLAVALLIVSIVVSIIWCGFSLSESLGKCDFEGYLTDPKTKAELFVALSEFERQHNLRFDYGYAAPSCGSKGINVTLEYETPTQFSKYGIIYELLVRAIYSPRSGLVVLQLPKDDTFKTEDALKFIDSLKGIIAEFESSPQVKEFSVSFKNEGIDIRGTIHDDALWIETDPSLSFPKANPSLSAGIFYSLSTRAIYTYSLPNRITWYEFPEIPIAHEIINEHLFVGELSTCVISEEKKAYANTGIYFLPEAPSIRVDVKIICGDTADDKYLRLILHPDGSYESEGIK